LNTGANADEPDKTFNEHVDLAARALHEWLKIDVNDPDTTWSEPGYRFYVRGDWANEAFAAAPVHFMLGALCLIVAPLIAPRGKRGIVAAFGSSIVLGWIFFSMVLRWQPFHTRLTLSLSLLLCVIIGITFDRIPAQRFAIVRHVALLIITLGFVAMAVPCALYNDFHPMVGPSSVFKNSRFDQLFYTYRRFKKPTVAVAEEICRRKVDRVGLETDGTAIEYPMWVALKQCNPNIRMENQKVDSYAAPVYKNAPFKEPSPPDAIVYRGHLPTVNKK
jgi:hypothetical protein